MSLGLTRGRRRWRRPAPTPPHTGTARPSPSRSSLHCPSCRLPSPAMAGGAGGMAHAMRFVLPTALLETLLLLVGVLLIACPIV